MRTFFSFVANSIFNRTRSSGGLLGLILFVSALLFSGCESMSVSVHDRFSPVPPKTQVFDGDQAKIMTAALQAFRKLDLRVLKSSPSHIQAASRIHPSEPFGNSRQLVVELHLNEAGPGKIEVEMTATEEVESQSAGGSSVEALRDSGFFTTYFATLQQVLAEEAGVSAPDKK